MAEIKRLFMVSTGTLFACGRRISLSDRLQRPK